VAVELNRNIVARANWPHTGLSDGDRLEIVQFVGGGCAPGQTEAREPAISGLMAPAGKASIP
jgi:hypothetical protein